MSAVAGRVAPVSPSVHTHRFDLQGEAKEFDAGKKRDMRIFVLPFSLAFIGGGSALALWFIVSTRSLDPEVLLYWVIFVMTGAFPLALARMMTRQPSPGSLSISPKGLTFHWEDGDQAILEWPPKGEDLNIADYHPRHDAPRSWEFGETSRRICWVRPGRAALWYPLSKPAVGAILSSVPESVRVHDDRMPGRNGIGTFHRIRGK